MMGYDNDGTSTIKAMLVENNALQRMDMEANAKMIKLELNSQIKGLRQDMANDTHAQQRDLRAILKEELEANNAKIAMVIADNNQRMFDYIEQNNRKLYDFIERNNRAISQILDSSLANSNERTNYVLGELRTETDRQRHDISMLKRRD